jgi:inner membrane transporter RhtA
MARSRLTFSNAANLAPPQAWFAISAVFHYLGPSFAVLLFPSVGVLGIAWSGSRPPRRSSRHGRRRGGP